MRFPSAQRYKTAILESTKCFDDKALRGSSVVLDWWSGEPVCMQGDSSIVFKLESSKGSWAVKCYIDDAPDLAQHYKALRGYFIEQRSPGTAGFQPAAKPTLLHWKRPPYSCPMDLLVPADWQNKGIKIDKHFYPVLVMPWIDGTTLRQTVSENVQRPKMLLDLAASIAACADLLNQSNFVHGSLTPDNIICTPTGLKLVGYDHSMVPGSSRGTASDNLGATLLYAALVILAYEPARFASNEFLLLTPEDLGSPDASDLSVALKSHPQKMVRDAYKMLAQACSLPPDEVPPLEPLQIGSLTAPQTLPQWLTTGLDDRAPIVDEDTTTVSTGGASDLSSESVTAAGSVSKLQLLNQYSISIGETPGAIAPVLNAATLGALNLTPKVAQLSVPVSIALVVLSVVWEVTAHQIILVIGFDVLVLLLNLLLWYGVYVTDPVIQSLKHNRTLLAARLDMLRGVLQNLTDLSSQLDFESRVVDTGLVEDLARRKTSASALDASLVAMKAESSVKLQTLTAAHAARQQVLESLYESEREELTNTIGTRLSEIAADMKSLGKKEDALIADCLRTAQQQFVQTELKQREIAQSAIMGVQSEVAALLSKHGIQSASDVEQSRLASISNLRTATTKALLNWRQFHQQQAELTQPVFLPRTVRETATKDVQRDRTRLGQERRKLQDGYELQETEREAFYDIARQQLELIRRQASEQAAKAPQIQSKSEQLLSLKTEIVETENKIVQEKTRIATLKKETARSLSHCTTQIAQVESILEATVPADFIEYSTALLASLPGSSLAKSQSDGG